MNTEKHEHNQGEKTQEVLAEQNHIFELDEIEHELILKYRPRFIAKGGEHIVYEIPEHQNIIVKVPVDPLKEIIDWNVDHDQPIDSLQDELKSRIHEYLKSEAVRYRDIKKYFGADHVPAQKEYLIKIPITKIILDSIYEGKPPEITDEVWGVVTLQKRSMAFDDPNRISVLTGYHSYGDLPEDLINEAAEHLVFGKNPEGKIEAKKLCEIKTHSNIKDLLQKSINDKGFCEILKELVEKIITYSEGTGEMFDLAGKDNIVLYQKNGKWTYELVDTQFSPENKMIKRAQDSLSKVSEGKEIDDKEKHLLFNIFCFVWTINGLAEQVGSKKRINIIPQGIRPEEINFLKLFS